VLQIRMPQCTIRAAAARRFKAKLGFVALRFVSSAALMYIFQRDSACATLLTAVALQQFKSSA
jgi:hypothetical protein